MLGLGASTCMACVRLVFFRAPLGVLGVVMTPKGSMSRSGQLFDPGAPGCGGGGGGGVVAGVTFSVCVWWWWGAVMVYAGGVG